MNETRKIRAGFAGFKSVDCAAGRALSVLLNAKNVTMFIMGLLLIPNFAAAVDYQPPIIKDKDMKEAVTIVGFGNSITAATTQMPDKNKRWLNVLKSKLEAASPGSVFNVINSGVGGNSAREAMARFKRDVLAHDPDWVLLEFGGNNDDPNNPARRVTTDEFKKCLKEFRHGLPSRTRVVIITFPPVLDEHFDYEWLKQFGGGDASVERFRKLTRGFAGENGFPLVDLSEEIRKRIKFEDKNRYILPDGVHLTEAGNLLLAEMVFKVLQQKVTVPN